MTTKKVRIRKPNEGEQPGFISKLSKYTESKKEEPKYSDEEIYNFILSKIQEGEFPEQVINELEKFGIERKKVVDTAYDLYDEYKEAEKKAKESTKAPYDRGNPYGEETSEANTEETSEDYSDLYASDEEGDDLEEAQAGGQFYNNSIFPKPTEPYYVGADAEPYDNAYRQGGAISKKKFIKTHIRKLKKAAEGDQVENNEFYLPPVGTINDPMGKYTQKGKMFAKSVQELGNNALYKQQAEEAYKQFAAGGEQHDWIDELHGYGESLQHAMPEANMSFTNSGTMDSYRKGGILSKAKRNMAKVGLGSGRIKRANRALFGTPYAIPGVDVNYEFGPLGGLRKATADWDVSVLGDLVKFLPPRGGNIGSPFNTGYSMISTPARMRDKVIRTVNNQALNEVATNTPGSTATQNNTTANKKELSCPPGATYDANKGYCVDANGRMVFSPSTILSQDASELLTNPFVNPYADQIPGSYQNLKKGQAKTEVLSNAGVQPLQANSGPMSNTAWMGSNAGLFKETWTPERLAYNKASNPTDYPDTNKPWVPFTDPTGMQYDYSNLKGIDPKTGLPYMDKDGPILNKQGEDLENIYRGSVYFPKYIASSPYSYLLDEDYIKANNIKKFEDYTPEQQKQLQDWVQNSFLATDKEGNEYSTEDYMTPDYMEKVFTPALNAYKPQSKLKVYNDQVMKSLGLTVPGFQSGGFIDSDNPDLYKFIYGGDDIYAEGGYLPKAGYGDWVQSRFNTGFQPRYNKQREKLSLDPAIMNPFAADGWRENIMNNFRQQVTEARNKQGTTNNTTQPTTTQPTTTQPTTTTTNTQEGTNTQQGTTQQGTPPMFNFMAPPSRRGIFGFTRDFNYGSGFSPVNWQVPEGATGIREVAYKDRGKWYNPFDTKRVKEYYAMGLPGSENTTGQPIGTTTPGTTNQPGGTQTPSAEVKNVSGMTITNVEGNEAKGIDSKGRLVSGDFVSDRKRNRQDRRYQRRFGNEDEAPDMSNMQDMEDEQNPSNNTGGTEMIDMSQGRPNTVINSSTTQEQGTGTGNLPAYLNRPDASETVDQNPIVNPSPKNVWDPNNIVPNSVTSNSQQNNLGPVGFNTSQQGTNEIGSGSTTSEGMFQSNTRLMGNPFADAQQNIFNKQAPTNPFGVIRRAYGGEMDYMPEYMAYGGYIPMGKTGITVDQPEFSDPNYIGKVVEESGFSWDLPQLGADLFAGKGSLTGITSTIGNAIKNEKNFDQYRKQYRSSDAASPNTGQSGFGSAEVVGSNMGDRGWLASNSGRNIQGIGFEGNEVITKKGGQLGSRYKKGSVYTLTAKQIQEILASGGKVEYIK
jgi:hypothetical protein